MAIFQPTNIIPSTFSGISESTISPNDTIEISWQVNGNSPMTSYKIDIMENSAAAELLFSTGIVNIFDSPFYPNDQFGVPQRFTYISPMTWADAGVVAGNEYKIIITQYWDFLTTPTLVTQYSPAVFRARTPPTLNIDNFATPLTSVSGTFTAQYSQAQSDTISWARWVLTNTSEVVADTGRIPTSNLRFAYDGFLNTEIYTLTLTVETESGVIATSTKSFNVIYLSPPVSGEIALSCTDDGAVLVKWPHINSCIGVPTPSANYGTFSNGSLRLNTNASVIWDFQAQQPFCVITGGTVSTNPTTEQHNISLLDLGGLIIKAKISPSATSVYIDYEGTNLGGVTLDYRCNTFDYFVAFDTNGEFVFNYYYLGTWHTETAKAVLPSYLPISRIYLSTNTANTANSIDYIYVSNNVNYNHRQAFDSKPEWDIDTLFYANFEDGSLQGGSYGGTENPSARIYRQDGKLLTPLALIPFGTNELRDYGVKSNSSLSYRVFFQSGSAFTQAIASEEKCFRYNGYSLIEAVQNSRNPNLYEVLNVWIFGANIEAGSVTNNNTPNLLENFTKYPYRQPSAQAGKSGVLQALLKNVKGGEYSDNAADMEALFAISQSTNTFFLKDIKGNLYMVHTAGPITQTINDKSAVQEVSVSIPWQEIGDAEGIAIIGRI